MTSGPVGIGPKTRHRLSGHSRKPVVRIDGNTFTWSTSVLRGIHYQRGPSPCAVDETDMIGLRPLKRLRRTPLPLAWSL